MYLCRSSSQRPSPTDGQLPGLPKETARPLRELETSPARLHTFGNPFKVKVSGKGENNVEGQGH